MSHAQDIRKLVAWLSSHGVDLSRVSAGAIGAMGAGLTAAVRLKPGDVALSVPKSLWWPLSADAARERCHARDGAAVARVDALAGRLGGRSLADSTLLAADVALSRRSGRLEESAASLEPYVCALPSTLEVPLLWPEELRRVLLRGTSCEASAESQARLSSALHHALVGEAPDGDALTLHELRWGQSVLLSRAHAGTGKPFALVPALDLLNCGGFAPPSASVRFRAEAAAFELVVERLVAEGEQLTIDYGEPRPHRLLRLYGFLPEPAAPADGEEARAACEPHEEAVLHLLDGGSLPLRWQGAGRVLLPLADAEPHILDAVGRSLDAQLARHREGASACAAVLQADGGGPADRAAKQRAALCQRLREMELPLLLAAGRQLTQIEGVGAPPG